MSAETITARLITLLDYGIIGLAFAVVATNLIFLSQATKPGARALHAAALAVASVWLAFSIGMEIRGLS